MLIINADDFGITRAATDRILSCYRSLRITSATAMVFMDDSARAAALAIESAVHVGLHLNFTQPLTSRSMPSCVRERQDRIGRFLRGSKYNFLLFNPLLARDFDYVFKAQFDEFTRLYKKQPTHIDGHHHMHLCTNMVLQNIIPAGTKVRTTFAFARHEKQLFNRLYRRAIASWVSRQFVSPQFLYNIAPLLAGSTDRAERLREIVALAGSAPVELEVHPERQEEFEYLMSREYEEIVSAISKVSYTSL
jgi:predicted glycoside hydrolase/deacetylase ChbG (UPF0249 family)